MIAPWREWDIVSREDAIEYARAHNVPISATTTKIYSRDRNIWHISHEGGALEDPANAAPDEIWMLTKSPAEAPDKPGEVTIGFEKGAPVAVNGKKMKAFELLEALNAIGAEHGVGRIDLVENRFVGMKSRGCYETPGGALIMFAMRELEALTLDKNTLHYKQQRALEYAEMVYNGLWFTPLREALDAFFEKVSETTTGEVKLQLYKGNIQPLSRKSPYSLYSLDIASFTMGASYDQKDALGFINLIGLPIKVRAVQSGRAIQMKLWGGRFETGPSEVFERFSGSLDFDRRLVDADIRGSQAFARALERVGILTAEERERIVAAFEEIRAEAASPAFFEGADGRRRPHAGHPQAEGEAPARWPTRSTPAAAATSRSRSIRACGCARNATACARCWAA